MKTTLITLFLVFLVSANWHCVSAQDWHRLKPLKSTRADVERILGPTNEGYLAEYQVMEGNLDIVFSTGPCPPGGKGQWNIPKDVVTNIRFLPTHKRRVEDFKLDSHKFRKEIDQLVGGVVYYINDEAGITYEVQGGKVQSVEYGPVKTEKYFPCDDAADKERQRPAAQATTPAPIHS